MKVVFLSRLFYPHIGGVEKHLFEISNILAKRGYEITIISEKSHSNVVGRQSISTIDKSIKLFYIPISTSETRKKWVIWWWLLKNIKLLKEADIIHCHDVFFWYLPFRFIFPWKKIFTTFHGYESHISPSKKSILIRKLSERLSLGNICIGAFIKKWYKTSPDYITYGGVSNIHKIKRKERSNLSILFLGRIELDNGVREYEKLLSHLFEIGKKFNFTAIGNKAINTSFSSFGDIKRSVNIKEEIENADIVFASSYLSIMEALSQGKMVFSIANSRLKMDYLSMTPFSKWISISANYQELLSSFTNYLSSPNAYQEKLKNASTWTKKRTWESVADIYEALWKKH